MKKVIIRIFIFLMHVIYNIFKLRKTKKQITLVSRQSNEETLDFRMLRLALKKSGKYKVVVLTKKLEKSFFGISEYILHIIKQMWNFAASEVIVTDSYSIPVSVLKHKENLKIIQIWHAISAIKKFGYQTIGLEDGAKKEIAELMRMHRNYDYVISPSINTDKFFSEAFDIDIKKIVRLGLPRIDYIKRTVPNKKKDIENSYPKILDDTKKNILYVPTMRKNRPVDLKKFIEAFNPGEYTLIIKLHPLDVFTKKILCRNVIYDTDFMSYDFLSVADYVISDYSSFAVEAALAGVPLYFYIADYDEYIRKTGVNIDFKDEIISEYVMEDIEDLAIKIKGEYNFDKLNGFRNRYIDLNMDNCTYNLAEFIIKQANKNL